jgi:hypothetical protein
MRRACAAAIVSPCFSVAADLRQCLLAEWEYCDVIRAAKPPSPSIRPCIVASQSMHAERGALLKSWSTRTSSQRQIGVRLVDIRLSGVGKLATTKSYYSCRSPGGQSARVIPSHCCMHERLLYRDVVCDDIESLLLCCVVGQESGRFRSWWDL